LERALQWAKELPGVGGYKVLLEQAVYVIAEEDSQRAAAMIDRGEVTTDSALYRVDSRLAETDPDVAFAWISEQPPERRSGAVARTLGDLNRFNPQVAEAQLRASAVFRTEDQCQGLGNQAETISRAWATTDLDGALAWASGLFPGNVQNAALKHVVCSWIDDDPYAASEWIAQLDDSVLKHQASRQLASAVRDEDPEAAFLWSQTLHKDYQHRMMAVALRTWQATDDQGALIALENADTSNKDRTVVVKKLENLG